ncbi:GAF domain-containing protein [Hydrogenophaga sp. OTU3427]|uniref:GAF domain-containing protein n=1 Tax=Hydrogenophaga sp. OTU3427 TaxID=3043856 RepID=UPI00313B6A3F
MSVDLAEVRPCMEGAIPAMMATCAPDGTPNVAYISQVFHVDDRHVALSFQFFNKTRQNILAQPQATVLMLHPVTACFYRLHLRYLRTETSGPVFEGMKAQLAGIASHSGMAEVFRLRGADIYAVLAVEAVAGGQTLPDKPARCGLLNVLRRASERLALCTTLDELLNSVVDTLRGPLDLPHAMVLMLDPGTQRLYTVASCGYARSGVGSEIALGDGVIGVAARERTPVRVNHMTSAYRYSQAVRSGLGNDACERLTDIPYPGLSEPHSQLAVPVLGAGRLLGVLFVESELDMRLGFEDEDLLVTLAGQLGAAIEHLRLGVEPADNGGATLAPPAEATPCAAPLQVRCFSANQSIFINDTYLIKGVAGAILCKLLRDHARHGRSEFSNRELRLDPALGLPDVADNLEARLLLLQRRLQEQGQGMRIEKTGRGRFRLALPGPVQLLQD